MQFVQDAETGRAGGIDFAFNLYGSSKVTWCSCVAMFGGTGPTAMSYLLFNFAVVYWRADQDPASCREKMACGMPNGELHHLTATTKCSGLLPVILYAIVHVHLLPLENAELLNFVMTTPNQD